MDDSVKSLSFYAPIEKTDDEQRMVFGYASTEALDSQGEIVKKDALKGAIDDYMKFANIREMHQPSAVGKTKKANLDDKGLYIAAKVVDDIAWTKVKEGVYNGFSIGGRVKTMVDNEITALALSEISLVDRPANPEAVFDVFKAEDVETYEDICKRKFSADQRKEMATNGQAMPDGSFPIATEEDLHNAIRAYGRAGDKAAAKKHIIARARAMGLTSALPKGWVSDGKAEEVKDLKKDACDASMLAQMVDQLCHYKDAETREGDEKTVAALQTAIDALKEATITELNEPEEEREEMPMTMADKTEGIKKEDTSEELKEEAKKEEKEIEEEITEVKEEEKELDEEHTEEKEVADEPVDIVKVVDAKIAEGKMPTDEELDALLKAQELEVTDKNRNIMKFELAGLIVQVIEAQMQIQKEQDALKHEAKKVLDEANVETANTKEEQGQFKKILGLIEKAEEELKKDRQSIATLQGTPELPEAPDAELANGNKIDGLAALQQAVEALSQAGVAEALTDEEKDKLQNGVKALSELTSSQRMSETPENGTPQNKGVANLEQTEDLNKLEGIMAKVEEMQKKIKELEEMPMPVKVKASYQVIEKGFSGEKEIGEKKTALAKAEARAEEIAELFKTKPNDAILIKEAQALSANIMKLRREVNG